MWSIIYMDFDNPKGYGIINDKDVIIAVLTNEKQCLGIIEEHNRAIRELTKE